MQQQTLNIGIEVSIEGLFRMPNGTQIYVNFDGVCTRFTDTMIEFSQRIQYDEGEIVVPELAPVVSMPIQALSTISVFEVLEPGTIAARIQEHEESLVADVSPQDITVAQITGYEVWGNVTRQQPQAAVETQAAEEPQPEETQPVETQTAVETQAAEEPQPVEPQAAEEPQPVETQAAEEPQPVETQAAEEPQPVETQAAEEPQAAEPQTDDTIGIPTPVREISIADFQHISDIVISENIDDNELSNYLAIPNNQVTREVIETLFNAGFRDVVSKYIQNAVDEHGHKVIVGLNLSILIKALSDKVELLSSTYNIELQPEKAFVITNDDVTLTAVYITWPYFYVVRSSNNELYPEENMVRFSHFDDCVVTESDIEVDLDAAFENTNLNLAELKNNGLQSITRTCKRLSSDIPTEDLLLGLNPNWYSVMKYIQYIANQEEFEHPLLEAIKKAISKIEEAAQILTQHQESDDESHAG